MPHIEAGDIGILFLLVILEGLLSADNALVLALLVRHLPHEQQKRALLYGLVGAFVLRGIGIFFARWLMHLWWVCGIGSLYLILLAARHFIAGRHEPPAPDSPEGEEPSGRRRELGFWPTVALVELTDIVFAIDSILVAVALVSDADKVWLVYAGGLLGIILLRLAATFFVRLIERFPALDHLAYALVAWAGVKLASAAVDIYAKSHGMAEPHLLPKWGFWLGFGLIVGAGVVYVLRHRARQAADAAAAETVATAAPPGPRREGA